MNEITEQQVMDALDELIKAGKVRSFVKEGGDPLNPDDWLYEAIKSVDWDTERAYNDWVS